MNFEVSTLILNKTNKEKTLLIPVLIDDESMLKDNNKSLITIIINIEEKDICNSSFNIIWNNKFGLISILRYSKPKKKWENKYKY